MAVKNWKKFIEALGKWLASTSTILFLSPPFVHLRNDTLPVFTDLGKHRLVRNTGVGIDETNISACPDLFNHDGDFFEY